MNLADRLYAVNPSDASQRAMWALERGSDAAANVSVTGAFQNLQQLPLMVECCAALLTPGAAQYAYNWSIGFINPEANIFYPLVGETIVDTTAARAYQIGARIEVLLPTRWWIGVNGRFNAGANANTVALTVHGWYVPRGSLGMP